MSSFVLLPFPQKVYHVLRFCEEQGRQDIISWENNGTAFKVHDLEAFQRDLLPRCFSTNKYNSFTRALYAYGFKCVRIGRQPGIYSHPSFKRNDPVSPSLMMRITRKRRKKVVTPKRTVSNSSIEALNTNRASFSLESSKKLRDQKRCQLPILFDTARCEDDSCAATTFGRSYHTVIPQDDADQVTSPTVQIPPGSGLVCSFGDKRNGMDTRPHPNPISVASGTNSTGFHRVSMSKTAVRERNGETKSIPSSHRLVTVGNPHVAPKVVTSPQRFLSGSEQGTQANLIPIHDASDATHEPQRL